MFNCPKNVYCCQYMKDNANNIFVNNKLFEKHNLTPNNTDSGANSGVCNKGLWQKKHN